MYFFSTDAGDAGDKINHRIGKGANVVFDTDAALNNDKYLGVLKFENRAAGDIDEKIDEGGVLETKDNNISRDEVHDYSFCPMIGGQKFEVENVSFVS